MKVEVDILGVEQAVDFQSLVTLQFVVLDIFGNRLRVPITEEQMEVLTRQAARHTTPQVEWEETQERSQGIDPGAVSEPIPERDYGGVMAGLADDEPTEAPAGLDGLFDESEEDKVRKLRKRKPQRRTVPHDEAGNPIVEQRAEVSDFSAPSDDGAFAQG